MSDAFVLVAGRVFRPAPTSGAGWVHIDNTRVVAVGSGPRPPNLPVVDLGPDAVITPGFVDMHVHGGGGHSMTGGDVDAIRAAAAHHLRHGTTACVASLVSDRPDALARQLQAVAEVAWAGRAEHGHVVGAHLEGPFLSPARRGAHPAEVLLAPCHDLVHDLLAAAAGTLRMVTLAPELDGALGSRGALAQLRADSVTVAVGHTDADYATTTRALDAGATVGTHLFNGMRPMGHRDPGPAGALLDHPTAVVELVADGRHVHDPVSRLAVRSAGPARLALVTDAVAASGAPDGEYCLGTTTIVRRDGEITLADGSSLGGSDLTLAAAVRRAVEVLGVPLADAVVSATAIPAAALGVDHDVGYLGRGRVADLVVLDRTLRVRAVMLAGAWVNAAASNVPNVPTVPRIHAMSNSAIKGELR